MRAMAADPTPSTALFLRLRVAAMPMHLHELRLSPATLVRLGVRCFEPRLLLAGRVPCHAAVEEDIAEGDVIVPAWMLQWLGGGRRAPKLEVRVVPPLPSAAAGAADVTFAPAMRSMDAATPEDAVAAAAKAKAAKEAAAPAAPAAPPATEPATEPASVDAAADAAIAAAYAAAAAAETPAAAQGAVAQVMADFVDKQLDPDAEDWDAARDPGPNAPSDDEYDDEYDPPKPDDDEGASGGGARFDESALRAIRRQLARLPVRPGSLCAVQRVRGVCVLRATAVNRQGGAAAAAAASGGGDGDDEAAAAAAVAVVGASTTIKVDTDRRRDDASQRAFFAAAGEAKAAAEEDEAFLDETRRGVRTHVLGLLGTSVGADAGDAAARLAAAAGGGGHVLLCGPPGVGKDHTVRWLSAAAKRSAGVTVVPLSVLKLLGDEPERDAALDKAFERARRSTPSLIAITRLGLLSGPVDDGGGSEAASASAAAGGGFLAGVAAALLRRMRSLPPRVLVVGTAPSPRGFPGCLKSHGGFEYIVEMAPPTEAQRAALLRMWLPSLAAGLDTPQRVEALAKATRGYTPRDLRRVMVAAHTHATSQAILKGRNPRDGVSLTLEEMQQTLRESPVVVGWSDLRAALQLVEPSGVDKDFLDAGRAADRLGPEGAEVRDADSQWVGVGGYDELRARLDRLLAAVASPPEQAGKLGVSPPSGALLYGPTGNGKTLLITALARRCGWPTISVRGTSLFGKYVGETEAAIREVFRKARANAPALLLLDEIDALGRSRGELGGGGDDGAGVGGSVAERALSTLLNEMDGVGVSGGGVSASASAPARIFLVGCTNRPDLVDAALLRPGRLEQLLHVPYPDEASRLGVLKVHAAKLPLAEDVDLEFIAEQTERYSCAALGAVCKEAGLRALARHVGGPRWADGWDDPKPEGEEGEYEEEEGWDPDGPVWKDYPLQVAEGEMRVTARDMERSADYVRGQHVPPLHVYKAEIERFRKVQAVHGKGGGEEEKPKFGPASW